MTVKIPADQAPSLSPERRGAIEAFYGALASGSFEPLNTALTPDWEDVPLAPGEQSGPAGLTSTFTMLRAAFPDITVELLDVLANDDKAACRVVARGTHRGTLFGIPASGKPVQFMLHEFHDFAGERICRTFHLEDLFGLFSQIGEFPRHSEQTT